MPASMPSTFLWMNSVMKRLLLILLILVGPHVAFAQPPEQQGEYVALEDLPPQEQLPAAPLLVSAYAVVMFGIFVYVVSVARRVSAVQKEIERLESEMKRSGRG